MKIISEFYRKEIKNMSKLSMIKKPLTELDTENLYYSKYYIKDGQVYTTVVDGTDVILDYLCSDFTIIKIIYNEDNQNFRYELLLETPNGEKDIVVEKSLFTKRNLENLTAKGFNFESDKIKEVLRFALLQEDEAEKVTEYSYLGFKNNHFWGFSKDTDKKCVNRIKLEQSQFFDKTALNKLLDNAPLLQLAYVISASSAVQSFLGQKIPLSTMVYHFCGDSSQGKTTALMTTSVWGKPTVETGLLSTWNQTEQSLMNLLANNHGVTVALDESSICRFDMTSILYNISQGINRQRLQKNLQQQPTKEWLTTVLSSGESSLLEHTNNNTGLKVRVVEFNEPITLSAEHSNRCKDFFLSNYGHTGREISYYLEHCPLEDYLKAFNEEKTNFLANIPKSEKSPLTERLADSFTVLILTAQILEEYDYNIIPEVIIRLLLYKNQEICKDYNIGQKVLDAICDRIANKKILYSDGSSQFRFSDIEGIISPKNEIILLESTFDKIINSNNFSSKLVCLRALDKMGCIRKQRKDTYFSKITIDKISTKVLIIKLINTNNIDEKGDTDYEI